jgi:hypothetical protein
MFLSLRLSQSFVLLDQGIKFCSKIQSAQNHFKSNESIGLIVANPMQLIWVEMDIGSERYRVLFKFTNRKKRVADCTVRTVRMDADMAGHMTRGRPYNTWQAGIRIVGK